MECIFCQIANKEKETELLYEDERFAAFKDIHPKAPLHVLIAPKAHIPSLQEAGAEHERLLGGMLLVVQKLARQYGLRGYKVQINVGREGGQTIDHLHLHLLGSLEKPKEEPIV